MEAHTSGRSQRIKVSTSRVLALFFFKAIRSTSPRASSALEVTNMPLPWAISINPRASRKRAASRITARLTPNCSASSGSGGIELPSGYSP